MARSSTGKQRAAPSGRPAKSRTKETVLDKDQRIADLEQTIVSLRSLVTALRKSTGKIRQKLLELQKIADLARQAGGSAD